MKIEMIGYNDSKAIAIYGNIKMMPFLIGSFVISCLCLIPTFSFEIYELLYVFILPVFLMLLMIFQYVVNCCTKGFLKGINTKHKFCLEDGKLYKVGKEIKSISDIRLYRFKNYIF
ncbi:MAG: hypothetical protein ACI311_05705 [Bacilli bacterium]